MLGPPTLLWGEGVDGSSESSGNANVEQPIYFVVLAFHGAQGAQGAQGVQVPRFSKGKRRSRPRDYVLLNWFSL